MDVTGNNIANVNTVGFKSGRVTFKESMVQLLKGPRVLRSGGRDKPHADRPGHVGRFHRHHLNKAIYNQPARSPTLRWKGIPICVQ